MEGSNFNLNAESFVPKPIEDEDKYSHPFFGQKSDFFRMEIKPIEESKEQDPTNPSNFEMSEEQWSFIFKYYPEHAASPYEMMTWLFG